MAQLYEDADETMDQENEGYEGQELNESDEELLSGRRVHQCSICHKVFVSWKGLQQHAVIHTDQKPFSCEICGKEFRFKSNLFEHRTLHSGFTPHACPYCGKMCRLKGNLKKHLKTHVTNQAELEAAWRPFSSNRRPVMEVPDDAIIIRGAPQPVFFTPPTAGSRKRKLGLGEDPQVWLEKLRTGRVMPDMDMHIKMRRIEEYLGSNHQVTADEVFELGKDISFEKFDCPICQSSFLSRSECLSHLEVQHPNAFVERPLNCQVCLKTFADRKTMEQHASYHTRVQLMIQHGELKITDPEILLPEEGFDEEGDVEQEET